VDINATIQKMSKITENIAMGIFSLGKPDFKDKSLWLLIFSNLTTAFFAIKDGYGVMPLIWIYWFQSISIGFFHLIRIIHLKDFSTEGIDKSARVDEHKTFYKYLAALVFAVQYGFAHFAFLTPILILTFDGAEPGPLSLQPFGFVLFSSLLFFINHLFSFIYNKPEYATPPKFMELVLHPYVRILPMYFITGTVVLFNINISIYFFLVLKIYADVAMHIREHRFKNSAKHTA
jgi:hypothetical protein